MKRTLNEEKERILEIMKNTSYLPDNVRDDDPHFTENPPWYDDEELDHWNIVDVEKGEQNNIFDDEKKVIVYGTLGGTATIYFSEIFDDGNFKSFNEEELKEKINEYIDLHFDQLEWEYPESNIEPE
jgi:hypothetical protein